MVANPLQLLSATLELDSVDQVVVSPIVDDGTGTSTSVRKIEFFAEPVGIVGAPVFTIYIKSTTPANLDISTPVLTF